jgi:DNA recombination protein RmuC
MEPITILLIVFLVLLIAALGFLFSALKNRPQPADPSPAVTLLQNQVHELQNQLRESLSSITNSMNSVAENTNRVLADNIRTINEQLGRVNSSVSDGLTRTQTTVSQISEKLGKIEETNKQIFEVGKDISSLQEILRAPKIRGTLGELFLGDLLSQILPSEHYELQHAFKNGEKVDAVIKLGGRLVPIDSKFTLESFVRMIEAQEEGDKKRFRKEFVTSIKSRIDEIEKYIRPDEGTYDFALMYIPAENVYYETIIRNETPADDGGIISYALKRRVIPVSPNSFYAYLQAILFGLKGMKIEENAVEVLKYVSRLQSDFGRIVTEYETLGSHIQRAGNKFDEIKRRVDSFSDKLGDVSNVQLEEKNPPKLPA